MRRWLWVSVLGFSFVIAAQSFVYAMDPPHNMYSAIDCGECHGESLFATDPSSMTPEQLRAAQNTMCIRCHTRTESSYQGSTAPKIGAHDSATFYGASFTFVTSCLDCHHPHYQSQQLYWGRRTAGSPGQLFTGAATGIAYYDPGNNPRGAWDSTVVTYDPASLVVKAGSVWDTTDGLYPPTAEFPNGAPGEPVDIEVGLKTLEAKGFNPGQSPGRGAMFLPYYKSHYNSRIIEEIDTTANTITFKGTIPSNYETYMTTYGFAVYLGQKINTIINYPTADPNRPVYLFDRTGPNSYAHTDKLGASGEDSTPNGICQACHTQTKFWQKTPDASRDDSHYSGQDCMECHVHDLGFAPATTVDHTGTTINLSRSPAECTGCHDPSLDAEYIFTIHTNNCDSCHTSSIPGPMRTDYGSPNPITIAASNDCGSCHENGSTVTYVTDFDNLTTGHQVSDHSGMTGTVSATPTDSCSGCHDSSPRADIVTVTHNNNCQNCHNNISTDGRLHDGTLGASVGGAVSYGTAAGHTILSTINDCDACHSTIATDFENHIWGTATDHASGGSGSTMTIDTTAGTGDRSQENGSLCSVCHSDYDTQQATSDNLLTWRSIIYEHDLDGTKDGLGACGTCHNSTRDTCIDGGKCTTGTTVQQVIAANGNPTYCQACHEAKIDALSSDAVHGNHDTSAFGWDGNCVDCHATTNNYVVQEVHNDNCDNCHTGGSYIKTTNGIGTVPLNTNGYDGDATLAEGAADAGTPFNPATYTCTLCHPADGDQGGLNFNTTPEAHHIATPNDYAANDNCTQCHADSGTYAGDHTVSVAQATNCADCHTGTPGNSGPTFNIPTASGDTAVHDSCKTCHQTAGGLTGAYGVAQVMDDNATYGGTDGGGNCEACHTNGFDGYHGTVDHTSMVDTYANCSTCHTESGITVAPGDPMTHDACSTCHQADGRMSGSAVGHDNATNGGNDGGGTCFTCHDEYFDSHTTIDHSTSVALDTNTGSNTDCIDCHSGAEGDADWVTAELDPSTPAGDKKHDSCSQCHESDGALTGSAAGQDNSTPNGTDGGGDCVVCHGSYFDSHGHHDTGTNQVSFNSTIDRSHEANSPTNACNQCHTQSGDITTWTGVYGEHSSSCDTCHNFTVDATGDPGTPVVGTVNTVIGTDATANCTTCHVPKLWSTGASSTHGGHDDTHFAWDGTCIDCHSTTNDYVVSEVHSGDCIMCHSVATGSASNEDLGSTTYGVDGDARLADGDAGTWAATCSTCHPADGNAGAFNTVPEAHHIASPNNYAANDNCTQCHADSGTYAGDHTVSVSLATNCQDCHDGAPGNSGPTFNIPTASGDPAVHDSCKTCHQTAGGLTGAYGSASVMDDNGTYGGTDGGGDCEACHGVYFPSHTSIDHSTSVALDTNTGSNTDCIDCHSGAEGDADWVTAELDPSTPAGDKKHDSCSQCHESNGVLTGSAAGQDNSTLHGTDGGGDCVVCHGSYFDSHGHHDTGTNQVSFNSTIDRSHEANDPGNACNQCHTQSGDIATWTGVYGEHSSSCDTCHNFTIDATGDPGTPVVGTVNTVLGTDATANCTTCHVPKLWSTGATSTHGGHDDSHFGWGADNCIDCHSTTNDYVVSEVHSGDCIMCHTVAGGSASNEDLGSTTYGVDGDARLADGDAGTWAATCTTCHPADGNAGAFNTIPEAHHIASTNNYAANDQCTQCHADSGTYAGDHTSSVAQATNCADCHTGTPGNSGPTFNIPTASGDPAVHDSCKTCHQTAGGLTGAYGVAQVMDDNATYGGTDGGGTCEACHTSGFDGYHGTVDHSTMVDTYANCSTCHTESGITVNPGDPETHDACSTCHQADGRLSGSAVGTQGAGHGGNDGGGTCFTCHGEYFDSHTVIDHSTSVALDSATSSDTDCIDCHSGAEGDADWVTAELDPSSPAGDKKHDSCSQCHDSDGALTGSAAGQDNSTPNGTDGGGDCTVCHGAYFDSHTHHSVYNQVSFSSTTDRSQELNDDSKACYWCHDDATLGKGTSALSTWDSVRLEHDVWDGSKDATGGCSTCHDYTTNGEKGGDPNTPLLATVQTVVAADATANCTTCHVPKLWSSGASSTHGGHANGDFAFDADCADCHTTTNNYVVQEVHGNTCDLCHTGSTYTAATNGIGTTAQSTNGYDGDAILAEGDAGTFASTCTTCHPQDGNTGTFNTWVETHHDASANSYASNGDCHNCHTDPRPAYSSGVNIAYKQLACVNCHVVSDGGSGIKAVRNTLKDPGDGANSTRANNTQTDIAGHLWPNTSSINNYGSCFYCHGYNGSVVNGRTTEVTVPLHAMPTPTDKDTGADVGVANVRDVNLIGGGGWQKDCWSGSKGVYGAWSINGSASGCSGDDYRGGDGTSGWNNTYFPLGKTTINIAWGAYSQPKKASNATEYKINNSNLYSNTKFNTIAGLKWGYVADIQHNGNSSHVIPIFDDAASLSSLGVDTLSENTGFGVSWTFTSGAGPITARTITVDIQSTDNGATLYLVYGGHVLATGTGDGTLSTTVNLDTEAESNSTYGVGTASKEDLYHSHGAGVFWVVSDKGGSITLSGHANQGQVAN